jgi:glycosyltransferase involved in cell wall biosynthesis
MKVVVLMSTWQGERFVEAQLRSILQQLPSGGQIIVRDDGSTDRSVARMKSLQDSRVTLIRGENLGFARSFLELLQMVPADADVVMFSDQDDVWLPGKISRAAERLAPHQDRPALYCSRLQLVDVELRPIGLSPEWKRQPSFPNALVENIAVGCTCAINQAGLRLARNTGDTRSIYFHDWWLYLVISAFGTVIADPEPTILYRQHSANAVGARRGWRRYLGALRLLGKRNWVHAMFSQIENFRRVYADRLPPEQMELLGRYFDASSPGAIARLLLVPRRFRQTCSGDIQLRLLLLASLLSGRGLLPNLI